MGFIAGQQVQRWDDAVGVVGLVTRDDPVGVSDCFEHGDSGSGECPGPWYLVEFADGEEWYEAHELVAVAG